MNKKFFLDLAERALKTFVQVFVAAFAVNHSSVVGFGWKTTFLLAISATVASVLTSFLSAGVTTGATASLVDTAPAVPVVEVVPVATPTADTVTVPNLYGDVEDDSPTVA